MMLYGSPYPSSVKETSLVSGSRVMSEVPVFITSKVTLASVPGPYVIGAGSGATK